MNPEHSTYTGYSSEEEAGTFDWCEDDDSDFLWKPNNTIRHTVDANGDIITLREPENKLIIDPVPNAGPSFGANGAATGPNGVIAPTVTEVAPSRGDNVVAPNITDEELSVLATKTKVALPPAPTYTYGAAATQFTSNYGNQYGVGNGYYTPRSTNWEDRPIAASLVGTNSVDKSPQAAPDTTSLRLMLRIIQKIDTNHSIVMERIERLENQINRIEFELRYGKR